MEINKPLVSVCMITYNHEPFIARAIKGILDQETNFEFEIIIGEDASTDKTRAVCEKFAGENPGKIKLFSNPENKGIRQNLQMVLGHSTAKYIALCEGDDYWTYPMKLQDQVDFLEANPDYSLCSTRYKVCDTATGLLTDDGLNDNFQPGDAGIGIISGNMFDVWATKTCTVVYRAAAFDKKLLNRYQYFRDAHLFYHILKNGKGYCLNKFTSVYNVHEQGIWSTQNEFQRLSISLKLFREFFKKNRKDQYLKNQYAKQVLHFIDYRIRTSASPFFKADIHSNLIKYAILKKSPGIFVLKYRKLIFG